MNRRAFLQAAAASAVIVPTLAIGVGFAEATNTRTKHVAANVPNLLPGFDGLRVAFLADIHHGPNVTLDFIADVVRRTLLLEPDVILHGGDFTSRDPKYIDPLFEALRPLRARFGSYAVLGNHDHKNGADRTRRAMRSAGITELNNAGVRLNRPGGEGLWLAGVGDLWYDRADVSIALSGMKKNEACVMLSHNPDVAETMTDRRVGLMLAGHMHGGQMNLPGMVNPFLPSRYGDKYARGYVAAPTTTVYVSCGLGLTGLPVRYNCPPELTLLTLKPA